MKKKSSVASVLLLVVLAALYVWEHRGEWAGNGGTSTAPSAESPDAPSPTGAGRIEEAFRARRSGLVVETSGVVEKVLPDDREGDRHQRFLLRLPSGHTVLVAHNIDLAQRVPVEAGETVRLRGQYEYNARGGVLHWTHHDPGGRRPGGWIEAGGTRYR